jgi:hypothetical protein
MEVLDLANDSGLKVKRTCFFSLNEVKRVVARYYSSLLAHDTLLLLLEALKYMLVRLRRPTGPKCRYLFGEVYYRNGEACLSPAHAVARC